MTRGASGKEPLPLAFPSWGPFGIRFRRGTMSMLFGESGSHKTRIVLNAVINMGVSTLMFSTDSDQDTVASRILAIATRTPTDVTEQWLRTESEKSAAILKAYDFIRWDFRPDPTMDDIWLGAYAYHEAEGRYPDQIVIDIASDVGHDTGGDEWANLRDLLRQGKVLARETGAHVLLVHHASDSAATKKPCPRKRDMQGKVSALPEVIVTCGLTATGDLHVADVKNRHAKADADANNHFPMHLDAATSFVGDYIAPQVSYQGWGGQEEDWS
ncbi:AAA family ATPase [Streptomyces agglomeratus]|uniref:AAA family ATPase n=1 Tax=Streptomyces agglomeratus TaxID=285458 RepID=UPI0014289FCF|nr:AAA family ATPase [Streptomyces agglomeratus]